MCCLKETLSPRAHLWGPSTNVASSHNISTPVVEELYKPGGLDQPVMWLNLHPAIQNEAGNKMKIILKEHTFQLMTGF